MLLKLSVPQNAGNLFGHSSPAQGVGRSLRSESVGFVVRGCVKFTIYRRRQDWGGRGVLDGSLEKGEEAYVGLWAANTAQF